MRTYDTYIVLCRNLMGDWEKPDQPLFSSEKQASNWLKDQIFNEYLEEEADYYVGCILTRLAFKERLFQEGRDNGQRN